MTKLTLQRAPLQKNNKSNARSVHCPKRFNRVHTSLYFCIHHHNHSFSELLYGFSHFIRRNIKPVYLKCCTQVSSALFTLICGSRFFINILCTQPKRFQQLRSRSGISELIIYTDFYHTNRIGFANSFLYCRSQSADNTMLLRRD